ncbi:hypothetical protein Hypma_014583 [Hypsizygus marmoreus]|uniref:Uncharacterized protein n=1 Tax=Hypsizygus marmoreus TaxID=39966 RepID=A0A369JEL4_HYPMA|nr:hypothetical protein Hypma_014583 [Hypsizygus marmoreus]
MSLNPPPYVTQVHHAGPHNNFMDGELVGSSSEWLEEGSVDRGRHDKDGGNVLSSIDSSLVGTGVGHATMREYVGTAARTSMMTPCVHMLYLTKHLPQCYRHMSPATSTSLNRAQGSSSSPRPKCLRPAIPTVFPAGHIECVFHDIVLILSCRHHQVHARIFDNIHRLSEYELAVVAGELRMPVAVAIDDDHVIHTPAVRFRYTYKSVKPDGFFGFWTLNATLTDEYAIHISRSLVHYDVASTLPCFSPSSLLTFDGTKVHNHSPTFTVSEAHGMHTVHESNHGRNVGCQYEVRTKQVMQVHEKWLRDSPGSNESTLHRSHESS